MTGFFMLVMVVVLGILALVGGLQFLGGRPRSVEGTPSSAQLDRMESALGALEARLDDLQEQQRFLERLVAERPDRRSLPEGDPEESAGGSILFDTEPPDEDR